MKKELIAVKNRIKKLKDKKALIDEELEPLFMIRAYKPVLSTQGVRSIIHPLCGCATNVIQKNHLRVIMWLLKLH